VQAIRRLHRRTRGPLLSLADGSTLRAAGSVLYLALIALLSLGVAAAMRSFHNGDRA
jgi:hypothetical protein